MLRALPLILLTAFTSPLMAEVTYNSEVWISGGAQVIDGDSIFVDDREVQLFGIDAPELDQVCIAGSRSNLCGEQSAQFLEDMIDGKFVKCRVERVDDYERSLSSCIWNGRNVNEVMVLTGNAIAFTHHTYLYTDVEKKAQERRSGIWATKFIQPYEHRLKRAKLQADIPEFTPSHPTRNLQRQIPTVFQ